MRTSLRSRSARVALTSAVLSGALAATGGAALADERHPGDVPTPGEPEVLAGGLLGPLNLDVGNRRTVYVNQAFGGPVLAVRRGEPSPVVTTDVPGLELGSVSSAGSRLYYTTSARAGSPEFDAHLFVQNRRGEAEPLADLGHHERTHNPDGGVAYGFRADLDPACVALIEEANEAAEFPIPISYTGGMDSHPYASEVWRGEVLIADAGSNDIVAVDRRGHVRTVAVLPPTVLKVSAELAGAMKLPSCVVGENYLLEAVPTDVEVGHDGWLYVTSLPGGPEGDPNAPALGAVYKVHPQDGQVQLVATGLTSATNLAIGRKGEIYVTELFANRVSVIPRGSSTPQPFLELVTPAAVEVDGRSLYVTTEALPSGPDAPPSGNVVEIELDY